MQSLITREELSACARRFGPKEWLPVADAPAAGAAGPCMGLAAHGPSNRGAHLGAGGDAGDKPAKIPLDGDEAQEFGDTVVDGLPDLGGTCASCFVISPYFVPGDDILRAFRRHRARRTRALC